MWGCKNERGFTLLEILIAITLLAFITMGVISITDNAIGTKDRTNELNKNNLAIESALSRFEWDFSQIYSPLYFSTVMNLQAGNGAAATDNDGDGQPDTPPQVPGQPPAAPAAQPNVQLQQYYEQVAERMQQNEHFSALSKEGLPIPRFYSPEKNIFEFLTASNRRKIENVRQSSFAWVRYALTDMTAEQVKDQDEQNSQIPKSLKNLTRWFDPNDPWGTKRIDIENLKGAVLLEHVESLEFSFWDYQRKKWENNLRTIQNGDSIIRGVKIFITWYDSQGVKRTAERIFRNHWPMVIPQDVPATTAPGTTPPVTTPPAEDDEI
ncbi:MAG: prepilin-type N-terminal cleavage/methylation domain-containing protein [Bdellovibrionota bacterium]